MDLKIDVKRQPQGPDAANTAAVWFGFRGTAHKADKTRLSTGKTRGVATRESSTASNGMVKCLLVG